METPETTPQLTPEKAIFLSEEAQYYLQKAGQWANFLGIMGFIATGFILIAALFIGAVFSNMAKINPSVQYPAWMGSAMSFFYVLFAVFNFFFALYLYQFAGRIKNAILYEKSEEITVALSKLKSFFKLWGITTIVFIALYITAIIGVITFAATLASHMPSSSGSQL